MVFHLVNRSACDQFLVDLGNYSGEGCFNIPLIVPYQVTLIYSPLLLLNLIKLNYFNYLASILTKYILRHTSEKSEAE